MIVTQNVCFVVDWASGDLRVQLRSKGSAALAALAMAAVLSGCGTPDTGAGEPWFAKPFDAFGKKGGYTFSELQESKQRQRPITANDLVSGNGSCPSPVVQAPAAAANQDAASAASAAPPDTASLLGGGVALGMSECDVVFRAGQPTTVELGNTPNGDRTAVLTYGSGPRPGVYRFERGELVQMDRVAVQAPPPQPDKKKTARAGKSAKSAKSNKPQKKDDQG
jgi:hypothetical protein